MCATDGIYAHANGPSGPAQSIGWYLSLYWPAMQKEFKGVVQKYDEESKHHTVKWDNAPKGSDGVTEVDLTEGELTWLKAPKTTTTGGGAGTSRGGKGTVGGGGGGGASGGGGGGRGKKAGVMKYSASDTMQDLEMRFSGKTTKAVAFAVLKKSGPEGMTLQEIVDESQRLRLRDWGECKQPKTTINVCVTSDPAFVKISPGRVGLRINGAVPMDYNAQRKADKAASLEPKKRGRPPKNANEKVKKIRPEPQHWERKPPIDLAISVSKNDGSFIANAPITVPYNVTIKSLKKRISVMTKGALKPQFQKLSFEGRDIGEDEDAFLVHTVRPAKVDRELALALVITAD